MHQNIGDKIKRKRKELGFTLKELAGDRITPAQISAIENGKSNPSSSLLGYIAEKLQVDVEYFTLSCEERYKLQFDEIREQSKSKFDEGAYGASEEIISSAYDMLQYLSEEQKGFYYYMKGDIAYKNSCFSEAFDFYVKGLAHYLKTKDINKTADSYTKIGNCLYSTEKYEMALGYYLSASKYIENGLENDVVAKIYFNLTICYLALKRLNLCRENMDKCLDFMDKNECSKKDNYLPGLDMISGILLRELKDNKVSLKNFDDAFEKYKLDNDISGMGKAKNNAALCLWDMGEYERAIEYFDESINYKMQCGEKTLIDTYLNIADLYKEMGRMDKAIEVIDAAEEKMLNQDSPKGIIEVFLTRFEYLFGMGEYERAEISAFLALDYIQKNGDTRAESRLYIKLSDMYRKMGDDKSSIDYVFKAKALIVENKFLD